MYRPKRLKRKARRVLHKIVAAAVFASTTIVTIVGFALVDDVNKEQLIPPIIAEDISDEKEAYFATLALVQSREGEEFRAAVEEYYAALQTQTTSTLPEKFMQLPLESEVITHIYESAVEANIPPEILFSIAWRESTFNPQAKSGTNDHGLFQINEINFNWLSQALEVNFEENVYDPFTNTDGSVYILTNYISRYRNEDWHHVLMRYNLGPGGASKLIKEGTNSTAYSRAILEYAEETFGFVAESF